MQIIIIISVLAILGVKCAHPEIQIKVPPPLSLGGGPPASQAITPSSYTFRSERRTELQPQETPQQPHELQISLVGNQAAVQEPTSVINDNNCSQLWTQVYNLTEEILDSNPNTPYKRVLEAFRQVLEDIGAPLLIDAANSALGQRDQRKVVREVEKLRTKFSQLGNRKNILTKYPEYNSLLEKFGKNMADFDGQCKNATGSKTFLCNSCYLPAYIGDFILNSILIEEETGYQLVNFQESVRDIFDTIMKELKKKSKPQRSPKRRTQRDEPKSTTMLEQKEIKVLEKFQSALKAKIGKRGESDGSSMSIIIIVVILIILVIFVAVFTLMKRKK